MSTFLQVTSRVHYLNPFMRIEGGGKKMFEPRRQFAGESGGAAQRGGVFIYLDP